MRRFWRAWVAVLAIGVSLGRRVQEAVHVPPSPFTLTRREDALDASLLLLFRTPDAPIGGNPSLSNFGLRKRHMRGAILP